MTLPGRPQHAIRRSTRLPLEVPVLLTGLDPRMSFSDECSTTLVNAHGCGLIVTRPIASGTRVRIEIVSAKRHGTARVAELVPLGGEPETWLVGLELDFPGNFWGIQYAPSDWKTENNWPVVEPGPTDHESIAAATQVPSRKWTLSDISVGACYMESTLPYPIGTAVLMSIRAADTDCLLEGIVRVSHSGSGMGVEFTHAQGDLTARVDELIERLTSSREVPRIFVGRKERPAAGHDGAADTAHDAADSPAQNAAPGGKPDPLRKLICEGSSLTIEQFLNELRAQRIGTRRNARSELSPAVAPGQIF